MSVGLVTPPQATGRPVQVSADGSPIWMDIGATIAWELITAAAAATTLADGTPVAVGEKYIRYGTILVPVTTANAAEQQTVDLSGDGDPTGGDWDMTVLGETLTDIAWNVAAAALQVLIRALDDDPDSTLGNVTVSKVGFVYTIVFPVGAGNVAAITADGTDLTTGTTILITITTTVPGVTSNAKYAPFDSGASNGLQTLTRDTVGILNQTKKDSELTVLGANLQNDLTGLIVGGLVWPGRLLVGTGTQPTLANVKTAMPLLRTAKV